MITGKNIVCLGFPTWEGDYMKAIVQILSVLARKNRVLYVDYQYTYKDLLTGLTSKCNIPVKRMLGFKKRLRKVTLDQQTQVQVLTVPPVMPINWMSDGKVYQQLLQWNAHKVKKCIKKAVQVLEMHNPIVINAFNPTYGLPLINQLNEKLLLYYCYDEISQAKWCKKHGATMEAQFAPQADAIITTSEQLQQSKSVYNDQCHLVKNGVNITLFQQAFAKREMYATKDKPLTVGYLGSVDERLDYDLLQYCIQRSPQTQFHFVGRITYPAGKIKLQDYKNVHFLGAQSPEKLPDFVAQFDVGIIPFVRNGFTQSIYPLKVNEYLAAGLPVVATKFGKLDDFKEVISIASEPQEFLNTVLCEGMFKEDSTQQKRTKFARNNSWENRAEALSMIIEQIIEQKKVDYPNFSQTTYSYY